MVYSADKLEILNNCDDMVDTWHRKWSDAMARMDTWWIVATSHPKVGLDRKLAKRRQGNMWHGRARLIVEMGLTSWEWCGRVSELGDDTWRYPTSMIGVTLLNNKWKLTICQHAIKGAQDKQYDITRCCHGVAWSKQGWRWGGRWQRWMNRPGFDTWQSMGACWPLWREGKFQKFTIKLLN